MLWKHKTVGVYVSQAQHLICRRLTINVSPLALIPVHVVSSPTNKAITQLEQGKGRARKGPKISAVQSWEKMLIADCLEISGGTLPGAERSTTSFMRNHWSTGQGREDRAEHRRIPQLQSMDVGQLCLILAMGILEKTGDLLGWDPLLSCGLEQSLQPEDCPSSRSDHWRQKERELIPHHYLGYE